MSSDKFVFDPSKLKDNAYISEMRKTRDGYRDLISDLEGRVMLGPIPVFAQIIRLFPPDADPNEIKVLGKALVKYADLMPKLEKLNQQLNALEWAKSNPDLMALAFADIDFGEQFESLLQDQS